MPGVAGMAAIPGGIDRYVRRGYADGVRIVVKDQTIEADLYIVIQGNVNAHTVSAGVQQEVARDGSRRNELSVKQELQADCLAGVWAHSAIDELDPGDLEEALAAAASVGDDRIQASVSGRIDPESWTHGSSEQRKAWFMTGYTSGNVADCDTFT